MDRDYLLEAMAAKAFEELLENSKLMRDIINLYGKPVVSKERSATSPLQKDNQNNGDTDA